MVRAGVAVEVSTGQALQTGLIRDAALAVWQVGAQGDAARQRAALHTGGPAGAKFCGRPGDRGKGGSGEQRHPETGALNTWRQPMPQKQRLSVVTLLLGYII